MTPNEITSELRDLILRAAPDPRMAEPVRSCGEDELLDSLIPFSSVIVLGVVIAIEDRYGLHLTRKDFQDALSGGVTLRKLATLVRSHRTVKA
jgi:acyl carrier protein